MRYQPIERDEQSFQRPVDAEDILAMCRRIFGPAMRPLACEEIASGTYNSTFRITFTSTPAILRVAPATQHQLASEHRFMRNEHAGAPYLAPVAHLLPRTLGIDFTHQVVDRDYMFQSLLGGVPAPLGLDRYPRSSWGSFYRDLGSIARAISSVTGDRFGFVAGPFFDCWSAALVASIDDLMVDHARLGLDAADVAALRDRVMRHQSVLDQIERPRLLHGDLWTVNTMLDPAAHEPRITGVCDNDRLTWGDPFADWSVFMARRRPGTEREAFWDTYGRQVPTPDNVVRSAIYAARHHVMVRVESQRLGRAEQVAGSYAAVARELEQVPA